MPAIATLADNFDDNTINTTLWPGNFGTVSETGGRARTACTTDYAAFVSAASYTLAGSSAYARLYPPAAGGAPATAYAQLAVLSSTAGTEAGFQINAVGSQLRCFANVDYWDDTATVLTYDPSAHAWMRLRETGGSLLWDTSPDGTTWTTRRTLATPAWVTAGTTLRLSMEAHRDGGTSDFAEFDNVNTPPAAPSSYAKQAAFLAFF